MITPEDFNQRSLDHLPGLIGMEVITVEQGRLVCRLPIRQQLLAPNGFLHAATVVALADTACGYGTVAHLPDGAQGFTTIELKSNFMGTAREGVIECEARPAHRGRSTQVWDATVVNPATGQTIALFRCTQIVLWPR